jgi:hypothetical protein
MRRIFAAPLASLAVALAVPGVALAHHGHHHHGNRAHLLRFGSARASTITGTPIVNPGSPTPPAEENAGTVESFENGVLTIKLTDGSLVKGKVTSDTDLRCVPATPPSGTSGDDDQGDGGDQRSSSGDQGSSSSGDQGSQSSGDDQAHASDLQSSDRGNQDQGDDGGQNMTCTTELLKKGAVVREAELEVNGAGSVWENVVLVH